MPLPLKTTTCCPFPEARERAGARGAAVAAGPATSAQPARVPAASSADNNVYRFMGQLLPGGMERRRAPTRERLLGVADRSRGGRAFSREAGETRMYQP